MPVLTPAPTTRGSIPKYAPHTSTNTPVRGGTPLHMATASIRPGEMSLDARRLVMSRPYSSARRARSVAMRHVAPGA